MSVKIKGNYLHATYSLLVIVAGLFLLVVLFADLDLDKSREFAVLIMLGILIEWLAVDFPLGRLSGGFSLILASLLVYNLSASVWIGALAFFVGNGMAGRGNPMRTLLFNTSQQVLTMYGAVYLFKLIWGREVTISVYLIALIGLYFIVNNLLVYIYAYPGRTVTRMHSWRDALRWDALSYFFSVPFGIVIAILYLKTGVSAALLLFIPLLTVQFILRLYVRSELVNKELRAVYEITRSLGSQSEFKKIPFILLKEMRKVVPFHTGVVYLWENKDRCFKAVSAFGPYSDQVGKESINAGEGFWGWAISNGEPEIIFNSRIDPRVKGEQGLSQVLRSFLIIPLIGEVGPLGLVVIGEKKAMAFSEEDLQAAVSLCATLTATLSNQLLAERVAKYRDWDAMTGLLNRKTFYLQAGDTFKDAVSSEGGKASLVLIDLDILGHINDGWGQKAGDKIIAEMGYILKSLDMPGVYAGRYGDDEFALILPGFDEQKTLKLVHKIRSGLADHVFSDEYPLLRIKASFGIAVGPEDGETFDYILKRAALALRQAKKNGRDRIVTDTELKGRHAGRSGWIT